MIHIYMYIFLEFCSQAKVYAFIALLILMYMIIKKADNNRSDIFWLAIKASIMIAITFGINKLCQTGYKYFAWLMAFIPHAIVILFLINYSVSS